MELNLKNKSVIVTGAAQGMGYAIAKGFLEEGAKVLACDINEQSLLRAVAELSAFGSCKPCICNVMEEKNVQAMVALAQDAFGGVDALINNAGVLRPKKIAESSLEEWRQMLDLNLTGTFLCSKHVFLLMERQGRGGFIANAASFAALIPSVTHGAYAAAKEAVLSLTRTCAAEFAPANVRVISYTPGVVATPFTSEMRSDPDRSEKLLKNIPMRRCAQPEDIANIVVYLASDKASYVTGCNVEIHGGKLCVQNPDAAY